MLFEYSQVDFLLYVKIIRRLSDYKFQFLRSVYLSLNPQKGL